MEWLAGTLIALIALAVPSRSYPLARKADARSEAQEQRLPLEQAGRATLTAEIDFMTPPDASGYIRVEAGAVQLSGTLRVINNGDRGSGKTVVELLMPQAFPN